MKSYKGSGTYWSDDHHEGVLTEYPMIDDNRWHHKFSQSWLTTTDICLERARREHTGEMENWETDAANIGTAVHAAIETCLYEHNDGLALDRAGTVEVFHAAFSDLMLHTDWRWVKYTEKSARAFGEKCVSHWHNLVLPTLPQTSELEVRFVVPLVETDERVIDLCGTIDYHDPQLRDWKTASRGPYQEWEYKRWAIQPTVYTKAWYDLGHGELDENGMVPFEYVVLHAKGVQRFIVHRGQAHWDFLRDKCERIAELIEREMPKWPLNDNQALCSAKWCPCWSTCKVSHGIE